MVNYNVGNMMNTPLNTPMTEYLTTVAFKKQIDCGCPIHSNDVLFEIFIGKVYNVNPDLFLYTTLTLENIQEIRSLVYAVGERYE